MKALILKDLRGNVKLALVGLLVFTLLLLSQYESCVGKFADIANGSWSGYDSNLQPLLSKTLLKSAAFFCAIFGAALGWFQTFNESHRDLWAFLIHRPVSRTTIFFGKTVAGLLLYALVAGLPLVVLLIVVLIPGHVAAPFEWGMVVPLSAVFLAGLPFYFAGMMTGLRQARWYASRGFGLGLALPVGLTTFVLPMWLALILTTLATLILAVAAWGNYQSGGYYRGQPTVAKMSATIAVAAGCGLAMVVVVGLIMALVVSPFSENRYHYSYYSMGPDGTLYKVTDHGADDQEVVTLLSTNENALAAPRPAQRMTRKDLQRFSTVSVSASSMLNLPAADYGNIESGSRYFILRNITAGILWYLDRHGSLQGYDSRTRRYIGSLDAREPYLHYPWEYDYYYSFEDSSRRLMPTARTVYLVDFKERTVNPVFSVASDDEIGGFSQRGVGRVDRQGDRILLTTRRKICLVNEQAAELELPYQYPVSDYPTVEMTFLQRLDARTNLFKENYAVWFMPDSGKNLQSGWKMPEHIAWLGPDQTVARSVAVPALRFEGASFWPEKLAATLVPPPLLLLAFQGEKFGLWQWCGGLWAAASVFLGWRLTRRYSFPAGATVGWLFFILLLGVAGLLTFLCVQEWPAREPCPHCKRLRTVDRDSCEHCGSKFGPPERNGTEIFEPLVQHR